MWVTKPTSTNPAEELELRELELLCELDELLELEDELIDELLLLLELDELL